jgi:nucleotide-binding universal stress UspA family protein
LNREKIPAAAKETAMSELQAAPSIVVGVDGSRAAIHAAVWAVDEAVERDIPLRLVYVIDPPKESCAEHAELAQAAARAALFDAHGAVEAAGKPVKIETEILWGRPLTKLLAESRWAAMICVGSMGRDHATSGTGSVATGLGGAALCPVAVISRPPNGRDSVQVTRVVAGADNGVVLRHAFEQARLRGVPLRAVFPYTPQTPDDAVDGERSALAQLNRRLARWTRIFPDVPVEAAIIHHGIEHYLAAETESSQLFVADAHAADDLCGRYTSRSSILTVRSGNL